MKNRKNLEENYLNQSKDLNKGEILSEDGEILLEEIVNGTTERGKILQKYYDLYRETRFLLSPEEESFVKGLYEDQLNIVDIYEEEGKKYTKKPLI